MYAKEESEIGVGDTVGNKIRTLAERINGEPHPTAGVLRQDDKQHTWEPQCCMKRGGGSWLKRYWIRTCRVSNNRRKRQNGFLVTLIDNECFKLAVPLTIHQIVNRRTQVRSNSCKINQHVCLNLSKYKHDDVVVYGWVCGGSRYTNQQANNNPDNANANDCKPKPRWMM